MILHVLSLSKKLLHFLTGTKALSDSISHNAKMIYSVTSSKLLIPTRLIAGTAALSITL